MLPDKSLDSIAAEAEVPVAQEQRLGVLGSPFAEPFPQRLHGYPAGAARHVASAPCRCTGHGPGVRA